MAAVTVSDIKTVEPGKPKVFPISHPRQIKSVRTLCSYTGVNYPELGLKFKCTQSGDRTSVIITSYYV